MHTYEELSAHFRRKKPRRPLPDEAGQDRQRRMRIIIKAIGKQNLADLLGLKAVAAVSNAVAKTYFPCSWYFALSDITRERGLDCDDDLFNMLPHCD